MKKRLCVLVFILAVAVSLALVGCSQSAKRGSGRIDLVPERANMIAYLQLSQLAADEVIDEMYAVLPKEAADPQTIEKAMAEAMDASYLDLTSFEEGLLFSDVSEDDEEGYTGTILKGSFDETSLLAAMQSEVGEGLTSIDYQGYTIHTWGSQETGLTVLASDLLVTGSIPAIEDVIAVNEGNMPSVSGDLLKEYDRLGDALVKLVVPSEPLLPRVREVTEGTSLGDLEAALDDMEMFSLCMARDGQAISLDADIRFDSKQSADDVKGMILLSPLLIGDSQMPKSVIQNTSDAVLALLPELLNDSDLQTKGSSLKIDCDLTVADIEAMTTAAAASGLAATVGVTMGSLTSDGLSLSIDASISNNTPMGLDMGDMQLAVKSKDGQTTYSQIDSSEGSIPAGATTKLKRDILLPLNMVSERDLLITLSGSAEAVGRSIPFSASVVLTTAGIESLIAIPMIDLGVEFGDLTADGLQMGLQANLSNSNAFGLDVGDLQIVAKGQSGNVILTSTIEGCSIGPGSVGTLPGSILIPLGALNESSIVVTLQTQAGFAGITLPINAKVTMKVPDIEEFVAVPAIDLAVDVGELTSDGLQMTLQTTITNSNPFGLDVGDLHIVAKDKELGTEYVNETIPGCSIGAGPGATGTMLGDLFIPLEILDEPGTIVIMVQTQAGLGGATIPINAEITMQMPDIEDVVAVPEIDLGVEFGDLTTSGLNMMLTTTLYNSNGMDLDVGDLVIVAKGEAGNVIFTSTMEGCSIAPDATGTISGNLLIPLTVLNESSIVMTVQTQAGFAGITIPINAKIAIQVPDIESMITIPEIDLGVDIGELTSEGLQMTLQTTITNPNPFGIDVGDLEIVAKGDADNVIFSSTMAGCSIGPYATGTILGDLVVPLEILNESSVVMTVETEAGFAGITLPIGATITIGIPDIGSLIPGLNVEISAEADFGLLFSSFTVQSIIENPSNVDLVVGTIYVTLLDEDGAVVDTMTIQGGTITALSSRTFSGSMSVSTSDLLDLFGSTFSIQMTTEVGIAGLDVTIPVEAVVTMTLNIPGI